MGIWDSRSPRIWQPQDGADIAWGLPITRGLAFLAPLGPADGLKNLVANKQGTRTGLTTRQASSRGGVYPVFGSSDNAGFDAIPGINGTTPVTIAWTQQVTSIVNGYPNVMAWTPTGATYRFLVICGPSPSYYFCAGPMNGGSSAAAWDGAIGPSAVGRHNNFVLQLKAGTDSADRTTMELFRDGVKITRDAAVTSFGVDSTSEFRIGNRSGGDGFQGLLGNFHIWKRVLTDSEARDWTLNPFITRAPIPRRIWVATAASGVSGTFAQTATNDILSSSGTTTVVGTFARTASSDVLASSGTTTVSGTFSKTTVDDVLAASGNVGGVSGTFAQVAANDSLVSAGTTTIVGNLVKTTNDDVLSSNGTTTILAVLARALNNDTMSASGFVGAAPTTSTWRTLTNVGP